MSLNLLVIILDEWRYCATTRETDPVHTPNIDRLARDAMTLTHATCTYPVCSPQRAMFMSGRYPHDNGVTANCNSLTSPGEQLRSDLRCWSDVLHDVGYRCGYVGKWHLDAPTSSDVARERQRGVDGIIWNAFTPPARRHGFAYWDAYGSYNRHFGTAYWRTDDRASRPAGLVEPDWETDPGWSAQHDTDSALNFLATRRKGEPWALVVSYNPPHMPFDQAPEHWRQRSRDVSTAQRLTRPNVPAEHPAGVDLDYFTLIAAVDEQIGRLLHGLEKDLDDTLVVVTADHGEMLGSHGLMGKNVWYDEALRVPLLIRLPHTIPTGTSDMLISAPDLYPTLLALLGVADHPRALVPRDLPGRDLSVALRQPGRHHGPPCALYISRQGPWKHLDPAGRWINDRDERGIRTRQWTYVECARPQNKRILYDLRSDPYQQSDIYAQAAHDQPGLTRRLHTKLWQELHRIGDPWTQTPAGTPLEAAEPSFASRRHSRGKGW